MLEKEKCVDKLKLIFKEKVMVKKMRFRENGLKINRIDVIETFINKIFGENQNVAKEEFIREALNDPITLLIYSVMDEMVMRLIDGMDSKLHITLNRFSLTKLSVMECAVVPSSIAILCKELSKKLEKGDQKEIREIYKYGKSEKKMSETIVNCIYSGKIFEIDFGELSLSLLVFALKYILDALPAPLFTFFHSKWLLRKGKDRDQKLIEIELENALKKLPISYLESIRMISLIFHDLFKYFPQQIKQDFCQLFSICFLDWDDDWEMNLSIDYLLFLFSNAPLFFSIPVNHERYVIIQKENEETESNFQYLLKNSNSSFDAKPSLKKQPKFQFL